VRDGDARTHIVVIGGGQAAKWLLMGLAERLARGERRLGDLEITVLERSWEFATGLAWSRHNALPEHQTSLAEPISRVCFGDEQRQQFQEVVDLIRRQGIAVDLRRGIEAIDLARRADGALQIKTSEGVELHADAVVLATGHWRAPDPLSGSRGFLASPWPARDLQDAICDIRPGASGSSRREVLILGTYLDAIDTVISLASKVGEFSRTGARWQFRGPRDFHMTMASRRGQLPRVWGRAPITRPTRFLTADVLESRRSSGFLPLAHCLNSLQREIAGAGVDVPSLHSLLGARRRSREQSRAGDTTRAVRRRLESDIYAVFAPGEASGRYEDTHEVAWQAALFAALPILSEHSHAWSAEDQQWFDRKLRMTFFRHAMPMTLASALMLRALMEAGNLSIMALGSGYECVPTPSGFSVMSHHDERPIARFTHGVRAYATSSDIRRHPAPLIQGALRAGLVRPAARAFREAGSAELIATTGGAAALLVRNEQPYLVTGGVEVNPRTREVIGDDACSRTSRRGLLFAMGPLLIGQFLDAHSLGQLIRDSTAILSRLADVR